MELKCSARCVTIKKATKTKMFSNVQVGDVINFSVRLKRAGISRGRTYATYITCENCRTEEETELTFNQIDRVLDNFDFEEIN